MSSKRTMIKNQILHNSRMLAEETIEEENGCHTLFQHIGLEDYELRGRSKRTKKEAVSSFYSRKDLFDAVKDFLSDDYGVDEIVNWVTDPSMPNRYDKCSGIIFSDDNARTLGKVCYSNGEIVEACGYRLILGRKEYGYTNTHTGLPFDIITVYVEE